MKTIAIVSAKGGVGKSTVCANLCVALRQAGQAVLALDLDPQNALRLHLGADPADINGIARASLAGTPWRDACVLGSSGVHLLPFGLINESDRQALELSLATDPQWLPRNLASLDLADEALVLIDTPPGPSAYLRQVLSMADLVVAVTLADAASYATLPMLEGLILNYCAGRSSYAGHAYIINQVDGARRLAKDAAQVTRDALGERVIGVVHQDQAVGEALAHGRTAVEHDPHSQGRLDLLACAQWLMQQLPRSGGATT